MSTWTHVVGCIRVDGLPSIEPNVFSKQKIKDILGLPCTYEKWNDETALPCGSEGSIQYEIIEYSTGLPWLSIPVWGDLRDYEDVEEIKKWWNETLEKLGMIRDAVLHIKVEGREAVVLTYKDEE